MRPLIQRVAIVDRGTAAVRAIRAIREYNEEHQTTIRSLALFTKTDQRALFVEEADEGFLLGSDEWWSNGQVNSRYCDLEALEKALVASRADAVWTGWGWMSARPELADLCHKLGIAYLGVSGDLMRQMLTPEFAQHLAEQSGLTLDLEPAESLSDVRQLAVQTLADADCTVWALGVLDTTFQFSETTGLVESPSPVLSPDQELMLCRTAVKMVKQSKATGLVSVKFVWKTTTGTVQNVSLQPGICASHPVTELRAGVDLVKLQIHLGRDGHLETHPPALSPAHAMGVELVAIPEATDLPASSKIVESLKTVTGPGLRIDPGISEGNLLAQPFLPSRWISLVTTSGHNRAETLSRLKRALLNSACVIHGYRCNKSQLLAMLNRPDVIDGHTTPIPAATIAPLNPLFGKVALIQAAIEVYLADFSVEHAQFVTSAARGRPQVRGEAGLTVELGYQGEVYALTVYRLGDQNYRIDVDGQQIPVTVAWSNRHERRLIVAGQNFHTFPVVTQPNFTIEVEGTEHHISREDFGVVRCPTPAVVVSVAVKEGDEVKTGDVVAVVESMKLEMPINAPYAGKVRKVLVLPNVQVDIGAPLIQFELSSHPAAGSAGERLRFSNLVPAAPDSLQARCHTNFEAFRSLLLGYDVAPAEVKRLMTDRGQLCHQLPVTDPDLIGNEDEMLTIFVDLCSLFQRLALTEDHEAAEALASQEYLLTYLRTFDTQGTELPQAFLDKLLRTLAHFGVYSLRRTPELEEALLRLYKSHLKMDQHLTLMLSLLERRLANHEAMQPALSASFQWLLNRTIEETLGSYPSLSELAREVRFRLYDEAIFEQARKRIYADVEEHLNYLEESPGAEDREVHIQALANCPQPLAGLLAKRFGDMSLAMQQLILEVLTRRYYRIRKLENFQNLLGKKHIFVTARYDHPVDGKNIHVASTLAAYDQLTETGQELCHLVKSIPEDHDLVIDFYLWNPDRSQSADELQQDIQRHLNEVPFPRPIRRIVVSVASLATGHEMEGTWHFTFRPSPEGYQEEKIYRSLHPMMGKRLHLWRLSNFNLERLPSVEDVYLFRVLAKDNPKDERLIAIAEVRDLTIVRDGNGQIIQIPYLEHMLFEAAAGLRHFLAQRPPRERPQWNRLLLYIWPTLTLNREEINQVSRKLSAATEGLGLERMVIRCTLPDAETGEIKDTVWRISNPGGHEPVVSFHTPAEKPMRPLGDYERKVLQLRRRGLVYPYEIVEMLTSSQGEKIQFPPGEFQEYDLNEQNELVPVNRPYGLNKANLVVGVITNKTAKYPEGMTRVIMLGDPSKSMGSVAELECRRILACIDLAQKMNVPLEWFPVSAGAKISMESGTENMDWIADVLRALIEFTQAGCEVNIVVNGINVGAQPYWNAEATMLMHTRGILIMTPDGAMVLTGKRALDFSGSVSAEDNFGIGGYDRVMGPNGQAQYWAADIVEASEILLRHYDHTYVVPGERFPRDTPSTDPTDRDIRSFPYSGNKADGFELVGEIFTEEKNAGRKRPFDIRSVMRAVVDQDHQPLERWFGFRDAEIPVVWDAHLGGHPVCMIGMESRPLPRLGFISADGPYQWTAGTLFPQGSKKVARTVNSASGNRPLVVLANLSGFDGSPESMRKTQLEFGAEIGRAVVNFKGPIVFCVVSRYHGGAYVVFSKTLNKNLEVAALEGSFASVIGGAPAAAVVFAGEVEKRTKADDRLTTLEKAIAAAAGPDKGRLRAEYTDLYNVVYSEKLGQVAEEFDTVHSVHRALAVGSLDRIVPSSQLRPYLIDAVERGMKKALEQG